jgi:phosphoribosylanthranilate isomerase
MVRVKICGITNAEDAQAAVLYGADAVGFIFCKSPRQITVPKAKAISRLLGPWVATVGVFMDQPLKEVLGIAQDLRLTAVQLHGSEKASYAKKIFPFRVIKTFHVSRRFDFQEAREYPADAVLFDTKIEGKAGGTGQTFNWKMLKNAAIQTPVIVSGGLNAGNVRAAAQTLLPYGVDVSSGVESFIGKKNPDLLREFIQNAKKN